jgi:hypothetical protein
MKAGRIKSMTAQKFTRYAITEYNRSERVLARLRDIYDCARSFHSTHAQILAALDAKIYKSKDWEKLTPYYRGVFSGTRRALSDCLYRYSLAWRVRFNGALVESKEVPAEQWDKVDVNGGAHVWADAPDKVF